MRYFILSLCLGLFSFSALAQTATISSLYSFNTAPDGSEPYGNLVQGTDGSFYGTDPKGGTDGYGSIFKISPAGEYSIIYSFQGGAGGQSSLSGLTLASDGYLYGSSSGGSNGFGMIFRVSPSGTFSSIYNFTNGADGSGPVSGVIEGTDGNFYGTTDNGALGYGTVFQLTPAGVLTTLHAFTGADDDGASPYAGLVEGSDGSFYGTTNNSDAPGFYGIGTIFKITSAGVFTNLYTFKGGNDGGNPDGGLVEGADGAFYGSTHNFGLYRDDDDDSGQGVLFKITPDGTFTTLYEFTGNSDSGRPEGTMALASDGNFYGTTTNSPQGTLFQLTPAGKLTTLGPLGFYTEALSGPIVGNDGNLYGTTASGGANGDGTVFKATVSPALSAPVQLTLESSTVLLGETTTLSWKVLNAYSNTAQHCFAAVQNALSGGGAWSGVQKGVQSKGVYSGSATLAPTASGVYTYALTCGGTVTGVATLTVPPMTIDTGSLPDGRVGVPYSGTLSQADGLAPFTWKIAQGSLPAGLALDPAGSISGTPSQSGISNFTVQVTDSESAPATVSIPLSIVVATATPTLSLTSTTLNVANPGASTGTTISLSGFASSAFQLSCAGLPAKAQCVFGNITGSQSYATATLQITTDGGFQSQLAPKPAAQPGKGIAYALALPGLLALIGLAGVRKRLGISKMLAILLLLVSASAVLSGCGGSSKPKTTIVYGTPTGTSTVTVTAVAGDQTATTTLTLTVQ